MARDAILGPPLCGTDESSAQIEEQYRGLAQQIPLLYVVAASCIIGVLISTGGVVETLLGPVGLLVPLIVWRFFHWVRARGRHVGTADALVQIRKMRVFAVIIAGGFSISVQYLIATHPEGTLAIAFFTSLAAIGCAFALSSDPTASSAPLYLMGLPLVARLVIFGTGAEVGMGSSLLLLLLLTHRLVRVQNQNVTDLVSSRLHLEAERNRAHEAERYAHRQALTDPLTGIANRRAFVHALEAHVPQTAGDIAVASIDLDGFKPINDVFGHAAGDAALSCIATRLVDVLGDRCLVARMGGDEFAVLWRGPGAWTEARETMPRLLKTINQPVNTAGRSLRIAGCVGIATGSGPGQDASVLLNQADTALYHAKARGSGQWASFSEQLLRGKERLIAIENALRAGVVLRDLTLVYQPIRAVSSNELVAFEALSRWPSHDLGDVGPGEFIPLAEQTNTISPLTERSLEMAAACASDWPAHIALSFNVSAVYLCAEDAAQNILSILHAARLSPGRMQLEVTETAVLTEFDVPRRNLALLRAAGARIALDDFGAGNASISYLREMNFDAVKFDGSLIVDVASDPRRKRLLRGLIKLCQSLGAASTAEHVATEEDLDQVRALGCDNVQGYLIGKPMAPGVHMLREMRERKAA